MVYFLTGVIAHGVSVAIALGNLTTVRIILDRLEIAGNGVGVHTVDVHIDFHLMTLILTVVQVLHNTQQLVGAGLAENGALQGAGAGEPGCARAMAVDHQRVVLILSQSKVILGSKAVDLLIQLGQICTKLGIRLLLGDRVLILHRILGLTLRIKMVLFRAHRAVAGAEFRAGHIIACTSEAR